MMLSVQRYVHRAIADAARRQYGISDVPPFAVEVPPNRALGDLAITIAFQLARTLRKGPRTIAEELAGALGDLAGVARVSATPNGYLNLFLDRPSFLIARLGGGPPSPAGRGPKTIVEHTAINPNKAAHIGHLRNAALGDTLVRVLRFRGTPVESASASSRARRSTASAASPAARGSITTAGTSTHASPSGTSRTRPASRSARRRCTTSSTAPARPPPWARSSSNRSSARTSRRWRA
jgi:hypothetical protein